jgi:hypothetical protein
MARAGTPEESGWLSWIPALSSRNKELQRELDGARRELEAVRRKMGRMEGQLRESQEEVSKLRGTEAMFRTMVLDQASVQEVSDDDIFQGFMNLRQNVQKISRSTAYAVDTNPLLPAGPKEVMQHLKDFYNPASWGVLALPDRRLRLRAKIYDELHHRILGCSYFGLLGIHAWDGVNDGSIEPGLRRFEYLLKERGGKNSIPLPD